MRLTDREKEALRKMLRAFVEAVDDPVDRGVLVHLERRLATKQASAEILKASAERFAPLMKRLAKR